MNKKLVASIEVLCATLILSSLCVAFGAAAEAATGGPISEPDMAANDPDQFAWHLFAAVSQPADNGTHQSLWQTWAEQSVVYVDPCSKPQWPALAAMRIRPAARAWSTS